MSQLGMHEESEERKLREQLYTLRVESVIEFDRPLGRFSPIRVRDTFS